MGKSNGAKAPVPKHVTLIGLGPSSRAWIPMVEGRGGRNAFCDAVWVINSYGKVLDHDMVWHMDDVRIQEIRAQGGNTKIANMLGWMKTHDKPIMTSRAHPDYPSLIEFPLEDVANSQKAAYFNSTVAYALAYAIHIGVEELSLYGLDFSFPNTHMAERGRACCEYWLGRAAEKGIKINVSAHSSMLDANIAANKSWYGYDTFDVSTTETKDGITFSFAEKETLPTAEEIEARYNTSAQRANHATQYPRIKQSEGPMGQDVVITYDDKPVTGMFGGQALQRLLQYEDVGSVLDIGSGTGSQAQVMRMAGRHVATVSLIPPADFVGDYFNCVVDKPVDAIWASHVLEHTPKPNLFLRKCFQDLRDDGILAITVPPMKPYLVGGHLTLWTTASLLYNMIIAGFDCSEARVSPPYANAEDQKPYNLSVIVRKKAFELPDLVWDYGDIETLAPFFPCPVYHGIMGFLEGVNWDVSKAEDKLQRAVIKEKDVPISSHTDEEARA